jgi:hypothetical protein
MKWRPRDEEMEMEMEMSGKKETKIVMEEAALQIGK